ncbi:acyl-CoA dehydrogenase [Zoogloea oryzae]|uniref:Acyl-CoA dehydrogenase n=1 Tax=Zoogloea oryzae TaxID=310767 RepID=A0ABQ6FEN6_9RHOO|nr:acyl-CoA dehydrogenase [Zoogloea oryzae]GLT23702.1 acyl-CoA dehydrogenase [Zoogloea oryzae]
MNNYQAPLRDMRFVIHELVGSSPICALPAYADCDAGLIDAVLEEAGRFAGDILSPLNPVGDRDGARWQTGADGKGEVRTAAGFADAYRHFAEGGWMALPCPPEFDGQGLPRLLAVAVSEMWKSANLSFSHVVTLTHGAIEALLIAGSDAMKATWLPKLVSGEWTGTMNITEPQAGSDLAAINCKAVPQADGSYRISGQKIFITYGDHDMAANIVHLVLARTPDAPPGVKGLSLFIVPKFILDADGKQGEHNDVYCTSIEHKLGVHGSPTTTLVHGDHGGSTGYLIGELGRGLEIMFVMMNSARLSVGTEGLGVAQRAWQLASEYAKERVQGTDVTQKGGKSVAIVRHPDVRRMLMTQRAHTEAIRALAYSVAALQDIAHQSDDAEARAAAHRRVELLTPVLKGWSTESAVELTSLAIQVFGGMGFVEETGISQYMRDARITPIYEGTTAIQAADLAGRKLTRDRGAVLATLLADMRADQAALAGAGDANLTDIATRLAAGLDDLHAASETLITRMGSNPAAALVVAEPFLKLAGTVIGGWLMAKAAKVAHDAIAAGSSDPFYREKLASAQFYASHILPKSAGLRITVESDNSLLLGLPDEAF